MESGAARSGSLVVAVAGGSQRALGGGTMPIARIAELVPAFLEDLAVGRYRIAYEPVPLAGADDAWGREADGRRVLLVP